MSETHASTYYFKMADEDYYQVLVNRPLRKNTSSRFRCVSYDRASGKWKASFTYKGVRHYLGSYATEVEAAIAYNEKALSVIGSGAVLNEIPENV